MDIQVILVFILAVLTVNLVFVGVYVVLVLKDFRETIKRANNVLDHVESVTSLVSNPVTLISGIISSVSKGISMVKSVRSIADDFEDDE